MTPNLKPHVTSLELSKRLKELGVPQESEFVWIDRNLRSTETTELNTIVLWKDVVGDWEPDSEIICSAFLSSELGEILPKIVEAEARGLMLEYLLKNGLLKLKE